MMEAIVILIGTLILIPLLLCYDIFVYGLLVYKYWSWFILPVFTGLPEIGYLQSVGIMIFMHIIGRRPISHTLKLEDKEIKSITNWKINLLAPWVMLLIAYLFKIIFL